MNIRFSFGFITSLISISLILFFLGIFLLFAISGKIVVDAAKNDLELKVLLSNGTSNVDAKEVLKKLSKERYVKKIRYVSPENAMKELEVGDDFKEAMAGYIPFFSSVNIRLKNNYIEVDSIKKIVSEINKLANVQEIDFPINLIEIVNKRSWTLIQVALLIGFVLLLVAYLLIQNTVKLDIYSKRMIIRTMQLIGATQNYIKKPFINLGLVQGLMGGIISIILILLSLVILSVTTSLNLEVILSSLEIKILFLSLILIGTTLGYISSIIAVNKYLDKSLEQLN